MVTPATNNSTLSDRHDPQSQPTHSSLSHNGKVALAYVRGGFFVFPCSPRRQPHQPADRLPYGKADKAPIVSSWSKDASKDENQILQWWTQNPDALIGLPCKQNKLLVVDADRHTANENGVKFFTELCNGHEPLPAHPVICTDYDGEHHIFRMPDEPIANRKIGTGLETRGYRHDNDGGYFIAPGSRMPDGHGGWRRREETPSLRSPLPLPPQWLVDLCRPPQIKLYEESDTARSRANKAEQAYALKTLDRVASELSAMSPNTGRDNTLVSAAATMGRQIAKNWIGAATVEGRLFDACKANGLLDETSELAIRDKIKRGIEVGTKNPHPPLPEKGNGTSPANRDQGEDPNAADNWPTMDDAAYYGIAGEVVNSVDPHTEADRVAILIQLLAGFGNLVGSNPYYQVESDRHHPNFFAVLVGKTSKARKGTAAGRVRAILHHADETWVAKGGLSSGEGLIEQVRDEIKKYDPKAKTFEVVAPAVVDKRLMIAEAEFGSVLQVRGRDGNTLSAILRNAWDGITLQTMTRNQPLKATNPHVSIIGHITEEELRLELTRTDMADGFANRFVYALVQRSKQLPDGGNLSDDEIARLGKLIKGAAEAAKKYGRVRMTAEARELWHTIYKDLSAGQPGLLGAITGRAEAQVIRLALIYALLDSYNQISLAHLKAAVAVWEYAEVSAARIFGKLVGDPVADEILQTLRQALNGVSRTALRDMFSRHLFGGRLGAALDLLKSRGLAKMDQHKTSGRPVEMWFATDET